MKRYLDSADNLRLRRLKRHLSAGIDRRLGYPLSPDFDYSEIYDFFAYHLNNIGDPFIDPTFTCHTKEIEREVIDFFAQMFRAPCDDYWGYVTGCGSEGNLFGMYLGRKLRPGSVVYHTSESHYGVKKAADILDLPTEVVAVQSTGEMDYADFRRAVGEHPGRSAIVMANIGSTMSEAKDDVARIKRELGDLGVDHFIHSDAALAGIYLSQLSPRPPFDLADGADSISLSGHKFIGAPFPCGVVITRQSCRRRLGEQVSYIGTEDTTIGGSRAGHAALVLWYAIKRWGLRGFSERAARCLEQASYLEDQLRALGWPVRRNVHAITVVFPSPPAPIRSTWQLANQDGWSHVVCIPGVGRRQIDGLIADMRKVSPEQCSSRPVVATRALRSGHLALQD